MHSTSLNVFTIAAIAAHIAPALAAPVTRQVQNPNAAVDPIRPVYNSPPIIGTTILPGTTPDLPSNVARSIIAIGCVDQADGTCVPFNSLSARQIYLNKPFIGTTVLPGTTPDLPSVEARQVSADGDIMVNVLVADGQVVRMPLSVIAPEMAALSRRQVQDPNAAVDPQRPVYNSPPFIGTTILPGTTPDLLSNVARSSIIAIGCFDQADGTCVPFDSLSARQVYNTQPFIGTTVLPGTTPDLPSYETRSVRPTPIGTIETGAGTFQMFDLGARQIDGEVMVDIVNPEGRTTFRMPLSTLETRMTERMILDENLRTISINDLD